MTFDELLMPHLEGMWRDEEDLNIGENISDVPEVKIIFDGYGYNEETNEEDDKNTESYAIFIHKDAVNEDFEFPEHEMTPWALIHRPKEEVCLYAWYDVSNGSWDILPVEDRLDDVDMTEEQLMNILTILYERYFNISNESIIETVSHNNAAWPFPTKDKL
jgi:hypothetical protein